MITLKVSRREFAAILAGLRMLDSAKELPDGIQDILTDCGEIEALTEAPQAIDRLCERLNFAV